MQLAVPLKPRTPAAQRPGQRAFARLAALVYGAPLAWGAPLARGAALACGAALALGAGVAQAQSVPTTFGTIIGNGLLCRDQTSNFYYYDYLRKHFGAAYKHEGGAYWFRTDGASLWGSEIAEVMVSDDTSPYIFVGAVAEATPEELEKNIITQVGIHYTRIDTSAYPVREAKPASRIVYFDTRSKIYCAKYKPMPPVQPPPVRQRR